MGLQTEGSPLSWEDTKRLSDHVRRHGIKQFINQYNKHKDRKDVLYWGDEIECTLLKFDDEKKIARLCLESERILKELKEKENLSGHPGTWSYEYGSYMIESSPIKPYGGLFSDFDSVEENMRLRRQEIMKCVGDDVTSLTLVSFPRTGCGIFTDPPALPSPTSGMFQSLYCPDEMINQRFPRFSSLTINIRERRCEKVAINIPVFMDTCTKTHFIEEIGSKPEHIYMDATGFGFGCGCLQVTVQAADITEAKRLYDQLLPLCPLMLALTAASPIFKGHLVDIDNRWSVIEQCADDRTPEERGTQPLKHDRFRIPKSRCSSVDSYLSAENQSYNDVDLVLDQELFDEMTAAGVDEPLSKHIAHLFIRDSLLLFSEKINQNDEEQTDHFENILSTNWQTLRFKIPLPNTDIGWRIEFRAMDVQLTDFENAAFTVFIVLLTRVIFTYNLNLVIPISKVDDNMSTAFKKDAVLNRKFYFKKDIFSSTCSENLKTRDVTEEDYMPLTLDEIFNGSTKHTGLIPMVYKYIESIEGDVNTVCTLKKYLSFISQKASGKIRTTSRWMRDFVLSHPNYKQDSVVSDVINYDLLKVCTEYSAGKLPGLLHATNKKSSINKERSVTSNEKLVM